MYPRSLPRSQASVARNQLQYFFTLCFTKEQKLSKGIMARLPCTACLGITCTSQLSGRLTEVKAGTTGKRTNVQNVFSHIYFW